MSRPSAAQRRGKILLCRFVLGGIPGLGIRRVGWVVTLGVTKKVPLSGEVRLGSYGMERLGSAISYHIILLTAYLLNCFLFSANFTG